MTLFDKKSADEKGLWQLHLLEWKIFVGKTKGRVDDNYYYSMGEPWIRSENQMKKYFAEKPVTYNSEKFQWKLDSQEQNIYGSKSDSEHSNSDDSE